jgi:hypothetical protein
MQLRITFVEMRRMRKVSTAWAVPLITIHLLCCCTGAPAQVTWNVENTTNIGGNAVEEVECENCQGAGWILYELDGRKWAEECGTCEGYGIGVLVDGKWTKIQEDEESPNDTP